MKQAHVPAILWAALSSIACVPEQGALNVSPDPSALENVEWTLVELDGVAITTTSHPAPTLKLSSKERRASGFAGCNRYTGSYELDGSRLQFGAMAATRMACPEPTPEASLLRAFQDTATWKVDGRTLELSDATPAVRTRWTVTAVESGEK
jgi:heat shock protein HslJ